MTDTGTTRTSSGDVKAKKAARAGNDNSSSAEPALPYEPGEVDDDCHQLNLAQVAAEAGEERGADGRHNQLPIDPGGRYDFRMSQWRRKPLPLRARITRVDPRRRDCGYIDVSGQRLWTYGQFVEALKEKFWDGTAAEFDWQVKADGRHFVINGTMSLDPDPRFRNRWLEEAARLEPPQVEAPAPAYNAHGWGAQQRPPQQLAQQPQSQQTQYTQQPQYIQQPQHTQQTQQQVPPAGADPVLVKLIQDQQKQIGDLYQLLGKPAPTPLQTSATPAAGLPPGAVPVQSYYLNGELYVPQRVTAATPAGPPAQQAGPAAAPRNQGGGLLDDDEPDPVVRAMNQSVNQMEKIGTLTERARVASEALGMVRPSEVAASTDTKSDDGTPAGLIKVANGLFLPEDPEAPGRAKLELNEAALFASSSFFTGLLKEGAEFVGKKLEEHKADEEKAFARRMQFIEQQKELHRIETEKLAQKDIQLEQQRKQAEIYEKEIEIRERFARLSNTGHAPPLPEQPAQTSAPQRIIVEQPTSAPPPQSNARAAAHSLLDDDDDAAPAESARGSEGSSGIASDDAGAPEGDAAPSDGPVLPPPPVVHAVAHAGPGAASATMEP